MSLDRCASFLERLAEVNRHVPHCGGQALAAMAGLRAGNGALTGRPMRTACRRPLAATTTKKHEHDHGLVWCSQAGPCYMENNMSICYPEKMREYPELKAMPKEAAGPLVNLFSEAFLPLFIYLDSLASDVEDSDSALYRCGQVAQSLRDYSYDRLVLQLQAHVAK